MKVAFDTHVGKCVSCLECDSSNRCSVCVLWSDTNVPSRTEGDDEKDNYPFCGIGSTS